MKPLGGSIWQYLGYVTNGDMGPFTFYTSARKGFVMFLKTWPKDPATYHQKLNRDRWRHAGHRWRAMDPHTKALWAQLARKANLTITGYNLFIYYMMGKGTATIRTCQALTGIDVITPTGPPIPYLTR